jgi:CheY-like chemotaxis protein
VLSARIGFPICRRYPPAYSIERVRGLIVEDEPYMAEATRDGLRLEAIAADLAGHGEAALELLNANAYDIAILDRDIPGPSGDEVARRIVASGSGTPILMLTAADRLDDKASGFELGADDCLTSPSSSENSCSVSEPSTAGALRGPSRLSRRGSLPATGRRSPRLYHQHLRCPTPRLPRWPPRLLRRPPPRTQVRTCHLGVFVRVAQRLLALSHTPSATLPASPLQCRLHYRRKLWESPDLRPGSAISTRGPLPQRIIPFLR